MALVTGSWVLDGLLLLLPLLYWYTTRHFSLWKRLGVPHMKPTLVVGNMGGVVTGRQHMGEPIYECYLRAGDEPFMGMFAFDQPLLMVKDPDLVGRVLASDFSSFYRLNFTLPETDDSVGGRSIFAANGPRWKTLRSVMTPGFTSGKMKRMFQLVEECGRDLVEHLTAATKEDSNVEVQELMACYTTDAVCSTFVGTKGGALQDPKAPMRESLKRIMRDDLVGQLAQAMSFLAPKLFEKLNISVIRKEFEEFLYKTTEETMAYRKKNGIVRDDSIDMLMRVRDGQTDASTRLRDETGQEFRFDQKDVVAQVLTFLMAGFETSASTMVFTLYELALNQELQQRIRQQVKEVAAKHGSITYEAVAEMTDLNNAVSEALRMYPVVNFLDRRSTRDYKIPGTSVVLPKDTGVVISVLGLHYDPRYWQRPHHFIPDRFSEENSKGRPNYTYLPFGDGPRQCIGMRMGLMQVRLGLAHILSNFVVGPTVHTPVPLPLDPKTFLRRPLGPLLLSFQKLVTQ
ncbi:cytochrome P450 6k1-like [Schistocerca gregaria]|uniref:cytochrome P450 6k1-like n=1 Tax=Schistocerca gregaria TaxID=7010 RepID=UPI00211F14A2|nr:cytochrome P450 6k1-like [Schistocerca gregaria]XP_049839115.1 cytochrome P450 6k1-like [Schistocerca gregaria]